MSGPKKKFNDLPFTEIVKDYESGTISIRNIAKKYKVGKSTVKKVLFKENIPIKNKTNVYHLSEQEINKIVELYSAGEPTKNIAIFLRVSESCILNYLTKKNIQKRLGGFPFTGDDPRRYSRDPNDQFMNIYENGAKKRNLNFELAAEKFRELTNSNCHYCGSAPLPRNIGTSQKLVCNGIDRINSKFGYTDKNTVPCCSICNTMKSNLSYELFVQNCTKIAGKLNNATGQEFPISLGFENVAIVQKKNKCESRLDAVIKSEVIKGIYLNIPLIAANMYTVTNPNFCVTLSKLGAMGVLHRAEKPDVLINNVNSMKKEIDLVAASVGVGDGQLDLAKQLIIAGVSIIFIDIAHGYSDSVINMARGIKNISKEVKVVVGNTTNIGLLEESFDFADAVKVGIAQGFACETKNTAGCTEKQFSSVLKFKHRAKYLGMPIISDGGIREPADFVKAIGAGASSVMAGKIFAECTESAADWVEIDGRPKRLYAGMASAYTQDRWRGLKEGTVAEGGVRYLEPGPSVGDLLGTYSGALRSGITYAGGTDISTFQDGVDFVKI